ncbi:MAG TPA: hypothetical protein VD996_08760 [Chitinophagaceae bacterium]|nr:hypothetical protein [Chitinophagaceae bacterium]
MRKAFYLTCLVLGVGFMAEAQQKKPIPKPNINNFKAPPARVAGKQVKNSKTNKHIPRPDISNFKPPARLQQKQTP